MKNIKNAIVTGAAGFSGAVLCETLIKQDIRVFAVVRPGSSHNERLSLLPGIVLIELDPDDYPAIPDHIGEKCDVMFHLMWAGERNDEVQYKNVDYTLAALRSASACGCSRFICTGSQAEYGVVPSEELICEDREPSPFSHYGKAKVEALEKSYKLAKELEIEWIWGRIFSLIGKYEPEGRMLPDLYHKLADGEPMALSSCRQNWDYLDVHDAADALIALAGSGAPGEIYNIANGAYRPLREFTEELRMLINPAVTISYGDDPSPFVSLQPSVIKIQKDTGWKPTRSFAESIRDYV